MKRTHIHTAITIALAFVISGCGYLQPAAKKIASGVEHYCVEPYVARTVIRDSINAELAASGHVVHVHCSGDPIED